MTTTPNLGLTLPTVGADSNTWGTELNGDLTILDGIVAGTTTNDNAPAGWKGEYVSQTCSPTGLTSGVAQSVVTLPLSAGDWDVEGNFGFNPTGSVGLVSAGISTTINSIPGIGSPGMVQFPGSGTNPEASSLGRVRISLAAAGNVYLTIYISAFSATLTATATLTARRIR